MKIIINNNNELNKSDINDYVYRARAILMNSSNEILLVYCDDVYQFPGGHLEKGETLMDTLKREVREETGIVLENNEYDPCYQIQYFSKNYPSEGNNRYTELNYYLIKTDQPYDLDNLDLDEYEKYGDFKLEYVKLTEIHNIFEEEFKDNERKTGVYKEIMSVINEVKKIVE